MNQVKGDRYAQKMQAAVDKFIYRFDQELPMEAEVSFHNSYNTGFDWGGWVNPNVPTQTDQASLFFNQGNLHFKPGAEFEEDRFDPNTYDRRDLTPRRMPFLGIFGGESREAFIERALNEAKTHVDDMFFMRNYQYHVRGGYVATKLANYLRYAGIDKVDVGGLDRNNGFNEYQDEALLFVPKDAQIKAKEELMAQARCTEAAISPPEGTTYQLVMFDKTPVRIYPLDALRTGEIRRKYRNYYKQPLTYVEGRGR
jgi:hypothetical protein